MKTRSLMAAFLLGSASLAGCASNGSPVIVDTTLARLELPEAPSRNVRIGMAATQSTYLVLTHDQVATPPSLSGATIEDDTQVDTDPDTGLGGFGEFCLGKRLSLGLSRRHASPLMGHVRFYVAGKEREKSGQGDFSLALSGAWGHDTDDAADTSGAYRTQTKRSETDFSAIFGLRLLRPVLLYGGPYYLRTDLEVDHTRPSTPAQHFEGNSRTRGGHLGLGLFAGRFTSWMIEYSRAKVEFADRHRTMDAWNAVFQLDF